MIPLHYLQAVAFGALRRSKPGTSFRRQQTDAHAAIADARQDQAVVTYESTRPRVAAQLPANIFHDDGNELPDRSGRCC